MKSLAINLLLFAAATISVAPFLWLILASFHDGGAWTMANFSQLLRAQPFWHWMVNSIFLASVQTIALVVVSSMAGFALAKYHFLGRNLIFLILLGTLLLPPQVYLTSLYELMRRFGWLNSYWAILAPGTVSVVGIILFRQASRYVPDELLHAARLDGCGELRLWWEICLPLVRPMTAAFALLSFLASWNGYLWPQTVLQDESKYTLPMGLANMTTLGEYQSHFGILMAGALLSILPVAGLFLLLQKDFLAGIAGLGGDT